MRNLFKMGLWVILVALPPVMIAGCGAEPLPRISVSTGELDLPVYEWGTVLQFTPKGNAAVYLAEGWSGPEPEYTWTDGNFARMNIPVASADNHVLLEITLDSVFLAGGQLDRQRVNVLVNDCSVGEWVLTEGFDREQQVFIPRYLLTDPLLEIVFDLPDASSPHSLGISADSRLLGVSLAGMVLHQYRHEWGSTIWFGADGDAHLYQVGGWSDPEPEYTWTDGPEASMLLPIGSSAPVMLSINVLPFLGEGAVKQQRLYVFINGKLCSEWALTGTKFRNITIDIPEECANSYLLEVTFHLPDAASPRDLGISDDGRFLGLLFRSIVLVEAD